MHTTLVYKPLLCLHITNKPKTFFFLLFLKKPNQRFLNCSEIFFFSFETKKKAQQVFFFNLLLLFSMAADISWEEIKNENVDLVSFFFYLTIYMLVF